MGSRYAVLHHELDNSCHYDWMFEVNGTLETWSTESLFQGSEVLDAVKIFDHRIAYLDYEGPVSNRRGVVTRIEQGIYEPALQESDYRQFHLRPDASLEVGPYQIELSCASPEEDCWTMTRRPPGE